MLRIGKMLISRIRICVSHWRECISVYLGFLPTIVADSAGRLWLAGEKEDPWTVTVMQLTMDFNWDG